MANHSSLSLLLLCLACRLLPASTMADPLATYSSFLHCMEKNTNPNDMISTLIFFTANSSYSGVLASYIRNKRFQNAATAKPLLIITAKKVSHLQASVLCTQTAAPGYNLKIRSGGHDFDGLSYTSASPFFVVDLFNLRSISIDSVEKTAWVQAGATVGELYYKIWNSSNFLAFPAGVCPTVGVGGHFSGGGYGNLLRKYGVTADNVVDAQVVDARGRLLDRAAMGEDFFWAIRGGGGGSFGILVAYKVNLVVVPATVTVFLVQQLAEDNAVNMLYDWQRVAPATSEDLFMRVLVQLANSKKVKGGKTIRVSVMAMYLGSADGLVQLLGREFPSLGLRIADCKEMSWINSVVWWANYDPSSTSPEVLLSRDYSSINLKRKSDYVKTPISIAGYKAIFDKMIALGKTGMVFNPYGGRMSRISSSAIPFPHRAGNLFKIQYSQNWIEDGSAAENENMNIINQMYSFMTPYVSQNPRISFLPYRDIDIGVMPAGENSVAIARVYGEKYFENNFDRLVRIKTAVDPNNFFHNEQSIPTL